MEEQITHLNTNRVVTVEEVNEIGCYYTMKEMIDWIFHDDMIRCLVKGYKEPIPILNRFEILDIREE